MTDTPPAAPPQPPRLFSPWTVGIGTLLCGPVAGGVLIGLNYRRLGDRGAAVRAFAAGAAIAVVLAWVFFGAPAEVTSWIPKALVPAICGPLAAYLAGRLQGDRIRAAIASGAGRAGAGESAAWIAGALAVSLGVLVPFILLQPPLGFHGAKHAFGPRGVYVIYFAGGVPADDRASIERYLTRTGYFEGGNPHTAQLAKRGGRYTLSLEIKRENWDQPELLGYLRTVRSDLEEFVLKGRVRIVMVDQGRYRVYRKEVASGGR